MTTIGGSCRPEPEFYGGDGAGPTAWPSRASGYALAYLYFSDHTTDSEPQHGTRRFVPGVSVEWVGPPDGHVLVPHEFEPVFRFAAMYLPWPMMKSPSVPLIEHENKLYVPYIRRECAWEAYVPTTHGGARNPETRVKPNPPEERA